MLNRARRLSSVQHELARGMLRLLNHLPVSQTVIVVCASGVVGLGTGVGTLIFRGFVDIMTQIAFSGGSRVFSILGTYYVILIPALGGLFAAPLIYCLAQGGKGRGVSQASEVSAYRDGHLRPVVVVIELLGFSHLYRHRRFCGTCRAHRPGWCRACLDSRTMV